MWNYFALLLFVTSSKRKDCQKFYLIGSQKLPVMLRKIRNWLYKMPFSRNRTRDPTLVTRTSKLDRHPSPIAGLSGSLQRTLMFAVSDCVFTLCAQRFYLSEVFNKILRRLIVEKLILLCWIDACLTSISPDVKRRRVRWRHDCLKVSICILQYFLWTRIPRLKQKPPRQQGN